MTVTGKIVKGIGGFYYVHTPGGIYECKARGVFRKDNKKPLVGDDARMEILDEERKLGNIVELLERKSALIRPAVANVDQALIIFAVTSPAPSLNLLDRFLIYMEQQKLPVAICFNKVDLDVDGACEGYRRIYEAAGFSVLTVSAEKQEGVQEIKAFLEGKTTTVAGPSGVGKSSLINRLAGRVVMETGEISKKIERGKNTTRHTELLAIGEDSYILDTPGFSSLDVFGIEKEDLWRYFPEFVPEEPNCRFALCSHVSEPDCGVKQAVAEGRICKERYENYCLLYDELKNRRKY